MMVVETARALSSGRGPREIAQEMKAAVVMTSNAAAMAAMRFALRRLSPSCPGLTRASTTFSTPDNDVDGRDNKPGHDDGVCGSACSLISPHAPLRYPCRYGHSAKDCTCLRHRPAAVRICRAKPRERHRRP